MMQILDGETRESNITPKSVLHAKQQRFLSHATFLPTMQHLLRLLMLDKVQADSISERTVQADLTFLIWEYSNMQEDSKL